MPNPTTGHQSGAGIPRRNGDRQLDAADGQRSSSPRAEAAEETGPAPARVTEIQRGTAHYRGRRIRCKCMSISKSVGASLNAQQPFNPMIVTP